MQRFAIPNYNIVRLMPARTKPKKFEDAYRTPITLPRVSILEKPHDLTPADYYAGKAGQAAAGLE
jgi:hypothetical protein